MSTVECLIYLGIYMVSAFCVAVYYKRIEKEKQGVDVLVPIFTPGINTFLVVCGIGCIIIGCFFWLLKMIPAVDKFVAWINNK